MRNLLDDETVQGRLKYVLQINSNDKTIAQAAREAQVDWRTMKRWYSNFKKDGVKGLANKPRGRSRPVDDEVKQKVKDYKVENRSRSGRKIRDLLRKNDEVTLNRQTVWRILKDAGENRRAKRDMKVFHDFERHHPNSLWQTDYMDAIVVEGVGLVYLMLYLDDHSRHIVGGRFDKDRTAYRALSLLWSSVSEKGMPLQIYCDQGKQFKSHLGKGFTHFETVCKRLGIEPIFASRRYPQGKGKIERLFGFIQDDFLPEYRFSDLEDLNSKFNDWMKWYNEEHEHAALGGMPPNSRYRDFIPRFPEGDMFEIFSEHFERKVRTNATISFKKNIYPVDPRYIKEKVEVRSFGNEIRIYAQSVLLGTYDSRIDYHEKMLRRTFSRVVKQDGYVKFKNVRYPIGEQFSGHRVEIVVIRDQLRAFLSSNRLLIFKLGDSDAVVVKMDSPF